MDHDFFRLRNMLLKRRRELLERVRRLEEGWEALGEREIELEEEAQKIGIFEPYDRLDGKGKQEIEQIDLALSKMVAGDYGICESCGDDIASARLQAIPWTRLCIDCAREYERNRELLPETSAVIGSATLPDEFQGLTNGQVEQMIISRLKKGGRLDTDELEITVLKGIVYLEGAVPGESQHQILLRILTDVMGFGAIVDRLIVDDLVWERDERTPGLAPVRATEEEQLIYDNDDIVEDVFEAQEREMPYSAPENPPPFPA